MRTRMFGRKGRWGGWAPLGLLLAGGCGPDPGVVGRQDAQIREEYEKQKYMPRNLSPEQRRIRRERLEMEFGAPKAE